MTQTHTHKHAKTQTHVCLWVFLWVFRVFLCMFLFVCMCVDVSYLIHVWHFVWYIMKLRYLCHYVCHYVCFFLRVRLWPCTRVRGRAVVDVRVCGRVCMFVIVLMHILSYVYLWFLCQCRYGPLLCFFSSVFVWSRKNPGTKKTFIKMRNYQIWCNLRTSKV